MTRRPPLFTAAVPVRLTAGQRDALRELALVQGMTQAQFMRRAILKEMKSCGTYWDEEDGDGSVST
jgi:hypothetical protein